MRGGSAFGGGALARWRVERANTQTRKPANRLSRIFDVSRLADHGDLDLPGELDGALDLLLDLARERDGLQVGHPLGLDDDPDLAARLDGVRLLDAAEGVADPLQRLEPLDVVLQRVAAGTRP